MPVHRRVLLAQLLAGVSSFALSGAALAQNVSYTYDALGRITTVTYPNGATITYTYDPAGNRTQVVQVPGTAPPAGTFSANPTSISGGGSSTLSWTSSGATSGSIDNGVGAVTPVAGGSVQVSPTTTTTYTLTLTGPGGQTTLQATVTVTGGFNQTIQITGTGPVNLRTLANTAGYNGAQNATIIFQVASGVTITSNFNGGDAIDTGAWPSGGYSISLTLQVSGKIYGAGGAGGTGAGTGEATAGGAGGDAVNCQENLNITVNSGGEIKGGGGGGGGGGAWIRTVAGEPQYWNGGGGGGGFPTGGGGLEGSGDYDYSNPGANGTTSGGGEGGAGGPGLPATRINGSGGNGGGPASGGASGTPASGSGGAGTWSFHIARPGGAAGWAVRKNGRTVNVTNNGTISGSVG